MNRRSYRKFLFLMSTTMLFLLLVEGLLRVFDPYGFHYALDGAGQRTESSIIDELRMHNPGIYQYRGYTVTINPDRTRFTPDTSRMADCVIVMLGDSITFAHGVNDAETFTNVLARQFPDVRFINTGFSGYNSTEILEVYRRYQGVSGFFWLMVANDADPILPVEHVGLTSYAWNYLLFQLGLVPTFPDDLARFQTEFNILAGDPRVFLASYGAIAFLPETANVHVLQIPAKADTLARFDGHPNAAGHLFLAQQMIPDLEQLINEVCR